jgi:hypothetical protein
MVCQNGLLTIIFIGFCLYKIWSSCVYLSACATKHSTGHGYVYVTVTTHISHHFYMFIHSFTVCVMDVE